ncbi:helix-turn-helix domain-containing protein [Parafrankia sp. EUN1f]|uniref:helix-turn-helix domain-containing protein n=1 Tax=Parafrankia sp. EUN1f TaxID=102897 RepID=UPI0001C46359|nr:transcriptional regulator, XRE family [Parafrankia sp. EUN1f]
MGSSTSTPRSASVIPLRDFLRARRARLSPEEAAVVSTGVRRVPGLRREEVAALVGVSVDYYVRLEQGRVRPSDSVLDAVARALRLDETERAHLRRLVHPGTDRAAQGRAENVRPEVQELLDGLGDLPALVVNARLDILAWNRLAAALICDFAVLPPEHRNAVWLLFVDPATRRLYVDWPQVAGEAVAILRVASAANADRATIELVDNLSRTSSEFRAFWARHEVHAKTHGTKAFHHPVVGPLTLRFETLGLSGEQHRMITYFPAGAESAATLRLLAAWKDEHPAHDNAHTALFA